MRIESLRVENFKVLRNVHLKNVSPMAVLLGANGSGKSTLLDVFAFLRDCVRYNVTSAVSHRGGFHELKSRNSPNWIRIELSLRLIKDGPLLEYFLYIAADGERVYVANELLHERSLDGKRLTPLFRFKDGAGNAMLDEPDRLAGEFLGLEFPERLKDPPESKESLASGDTLALNALGQMERYSTVAALRRAVEAWHPSTFLHLGIQRNLGYWPSTSLSPSADNLNEFTRYLFVNQRSAFDETLRKLQRQVPGLSDVKPVETIDGRIVLSFADGTFKDPFPSRSVSEGTVKLFALLLMLHEPEPHPLLTVEEPENDLYPQIVRPLAEEFRAYAERGSQVFVSTHSPDFVNALELDELYWMEKRDGFAHVVRAKDDPNLVAQHVEGELLGSLWREGLFGKVDPL